MIIATITVLFLMFGGGNWWVSEIKSVEKEVKQVLPDDERRESVLAALDVMKDTAKARGKAQKDTQKRLDELLEDHGSDESELRAILDEYRLGSVEFYQQLAEQRMALTEQVSEDEWSAVTEALAAED